MAEIAALTQRAMRVLREVSRGEGFNIGMNQGAVGGAGVAAHLHQHIVPRWAGDSNFFPIIAETKAMPVARRRATRHRRRLDPASPARRPARPGRRGPPAALEGRRGGTGARGGGAATRRLRTP